MGDGGEGTPVGLIYYLSVYSFSYLFCEGDSYPGACAQRPAEGDGFTCL
jgi:hypothetical protein